MWFRKTKKQSRQPIGFVAVVYPVYLDETENSEPIGFQIFHREPKCMALPRAEDAHDLGNLSLNKLMDGVKAKR